MKYAFLLLSLITPNALAAVDTVSLDVIQDALDNAAEEAHVPVSILRAICTVESGLRPKAINRYDNGSPSYGMCQIKLATARGVGFRGSFKQLYNPHINARFAAKYLRTQYVRYGKNWVKAISAYNGGRPYLSNWDYVDKVFKHVLK